MKYSITISFLIVIFALSLNHVVGVIDKVDENENRKLAEKPKLDIEKLDYYPQEFESYFNDNFSGRGYFIDFYLWLNKTVLKKRSLSKKFYLGKDNYIFEMNKNLPLYLGKRTVSDEELERIAFEFTQRQAYFSEKGIKVYIQIIPSKFKVYSDKLPLLIKKGEMHMGDRFVDYFRKNTSIPIIDGTDILVEKSKQEYVFLKYDTHWNTLGSFYLHAVLIDSMRKDFPEISPMDTALFSIVPYDKTNGNLKWIAPDKTDNDTDYKIDPKNKTFVKTEGYVHKMEDFRYGQNNYCRRYVSDNTRAPKVLVIRDSFASYSLSYLPEMFRETLFIWDDWKYTFNKEIVDIEMPDAIVYTLFEGYIDRMLMAPTFVESNIEEKEIQ